MTQLDLYMALRKAGYRYSDIASELGITRAAVWQECYGIHTSERIREHIAKILNKPVSEIFPIQTEQFEAVA